VKRHVLVVLTNAIPGREEEFNDWYTDVHLRDVLALDGFTAAERFQLSDTPGAELAPFKYLAIYEVAPGKLEDAVQALGVARLDHTVMPISEALDRNLEAWWYTSMTDRRSSEHG
jgi:hypothetical protein